MSEADENTIEKGGELPMVILTAGLDICAAVKGGTAPEVAAGCGVVEAVIDIIDNCRFSKYAPTCKPEYAHVTDTTYAPL
ncbi:hypothetical protein [[Actinomadura] parvosata]|uniref:hypothetical protein n=1 Tax=[Actinomadura] parvosata TaxID=1955412 RepID=UPI0012BB6B5C|nr:hypothetical protein [Nonomuraea sp. ATCC 55076]